MKVKIRFLILSLATFLIGMQFNSTNVGLNYSAENFNETLHSINSKINKVQDENSVFNEPSFNDEQISCVDSEKMIDSITETFHFTSTSKIDNISAIGKIKLLSFKINEEDIVCTLSNFLQDENINLQFYYENVLVDNVTLYFASDNFGVFFSSSFSLDTAKRNAGQTLNYDLIDDENLANENVRISPRGIGVTGSTSGTFK